MPEIRTTLSLIWVAVMLTYLLGDVLRIFSGDATSGVMGDLGKFTQGMWLGIAILMAIPILIGCPGAHPTATGQPLGQHSRRRLLPALQPGRLADLSFTVR